MPAILTIGHSNQSLDQFVALILKHNIRKLIDVRSHPYSRWVPHFNREALKKSLLGQGIDYLYMGDLLGGHPESDQLYEEGRVVYERLAALPEFRRGMKRVVALSEQSSLVLMCVEEDPVKCHRHPLLASTLIERGARVLHLRRDGSVQEAALIAEETNPQMPLFETVGEDLTWQSPKRIRPRSQT